MGKSSKAPTPPDPKVTAAAQTGTNLATAQANAALGNVNQYGPYGSTEYTQSGQQFISDPNGATYWRGPNGEIQSSAPMVAGAGGGGGGKAIPAGWTARGGFLYDQAGRKQFSAAGYNTGGGALGGSTPAAGWSQQKGYYVPTYSATTKLSPNEQQKYDLQSQAEINLARIAGDRSKWLEGYLKTPFTLDSANASRDKVEAALLERMRPGLEQNDRANAAALNNAGVRAGSVAYDRGRDEVTRSATDARLAAILAAGEEQSRVANLEMGVRNQPLNEIIGLMSGTQVQNPNATNAPTNMPTIPTVDYAGLVNENYNQRLAAWQQNQAQKQSMIGGIFSLGAGILRSDVRTKEDIRPVGALPNGIGVYRYRYRGRPEELMGVMAQEVELVNPAAVIEHDGVKFVDYGALNV